MPKLKKRKNTLLDFPGVLLIKNYFLCITIKISD
jgi:hypothetical protein